MNQSNKNTNRNSKRGWLILAGSVLLVLAAIILAISIFAEPMLKDRVEEEANKALGPEMELVIGGLSIGYLPLSVTLRDIELHTHNSSEADVEWPISTIDRVNVSGIGLRNLIFDEDFHARAIEISRAELHLVPDVLAHIETENDADEDDTEIEIGRISLTDSQLLIYRVDSSEPHTVIGGIRLAMTDIKVTPEHNQVNKMIGSLDMQVGSASHLMEDGHYELRTADLRFNLNSRDLSVDQFELIPLLDYHELPKAIGHEIDHFDISSQNIHIRGIDVDKWFDSEIISFTAIELNGLILEISRDKNHPDKPRTADPLLNEQFANFEIETSIDSLLWKGGHIMYRELEEGQDKFGEILFDDVDITFVGLQNRNADETIKASAAAKFLGLTDINVDFEFFLGENATQKISGSIGQMDLKELNPVIEPLAFIRVKEGNLNSMSFDFTADGRGARGELLIAYDNLSIRILDEETLEGTTTRDIASFLTNLIAIRSSNDGSDPRIGEIEIERDPERSMFTYWWHILRDGLRSSVARV